MTKNPPSEQDVDIAIRKLEECSDHRGSVCIDGYTQINVDTGKSIRILIDYVRFTQGLTKEPQPAKEPQNDL